MHSVCPGDSVQQVPVSSTSTSLKAPFVRAHQCTAGKERALPGVSEAGISDCYLVPQDPGGSWLRAKPPHPCAARCSGSFCCPAWERLFAGSRYSAGSEARGCHLSGRGGAVAQPLAGSLRAVLVAPGNAASSRVATERPADKARGERRCPAAPRRRRGCGGGTARPGHRS